jgi:AcrR family transcriptional regulator
VSAHPQAAGAAPVAGPRRADAAGRRADGPGARRRLSRADRRAQILQAAEQVFAERGYQGTSLEDIAAGAGVTRPLIYNYFADKDELYLECLHAARGELDTAIVAAAGAHTRPEDMLRAGLTAYFRFVQDRGKRWDMLFGGGIAVAGAVAERAERLHFETVGKIAVLILAAAPWLAPAAATAYAHTVSGAAQQLAKWWRHHPHIDLDDLVRYQFDVLWTGLEAIAAGGPRRGTG